MDQPTNQVPCIIAKGKEGPITIRLGNDSWTVQGTVKNNVKIVTIPKTEILSQLCLIFSFSKKLQIRPFSEVVEITEEDVQQYLLQFGKHEFICKDTQNFKWIFVVVGTFMTVMGLWGIISDTGVLLLINDIIVLFVGLLGITTFILSYDSSHPIRCYIFRVYYGLLFCMLFLFWIIVYHNWWVIFLLVITSIPLLNDWKKYKYFRKDFQKTT